MSKGRFYGGLRVCYAPHEHNEVPRPASPRGTFPCALKLPVHDPPGRDFPRADVASGHSEIASRALRPTRQRDRICAQAARSPPPARSPKSSWRQTNERMANCLASSAFPPRQIGSIIALRRRGLLLLRAGTFAIRRTFSHWPRKSRHSLRVAIVFRLSRRSHPRHAIAAAALARSAKLLL